MKFVPRMRGVVQDIRIIQRAGVEPMPALRFALGIVISLFLGTLFPHQHFGIFIAYGALISGLASQQGVHRSRVAMMFSAGVGIALANYLDGLCSSSLPLLVFLSIVIGYLYGTFSQNGRLIGSASLYTVVGFIVFSNNAQTGFANVEQSFCIFLGSMIQIVLLIVIWPTSKLWVERTALANVYRDLSEYAHRLADGHHNLPPMTAIITARQILADPQPFARKAQVKELQHFLADAERLRVRLAALRALVLEGTERDKDSVAPLCHAIAEKLLDVSVTIRNGQSCVPDTIVERSLVSFIEHDSQRELALALAQHLQEHVIYAERTALRVATEPIGTTPLLAIPRPSEYIPQYLRWLSRDAVRVAIVIGGTMYIAHTYFSAERGYWLALTAALILRPDSQTTLVRGFGRIAGTLLGALLATGAVVAAQQNDVAILIGIVLTAALSYLTLIANYALFSVSITVFIIFFLSALGVYNSSTIGLRVLDTLLGGSIAMLAYFALPSWANHYFGRTLASLVLAQCTFALALLDAYTQPNDEYRSHIHGTRTHVWKLRTDMSMHLDRAVSEPHSRTNLTIEQAKRFFVEEQNFASVSIILEGGLEAFHPLEPCPELQAFRAELAEHMTAIAHHLANPNSSQVSLHENARSLSECIPTHMQQNSSTRLLIRCLNDYTASIGTFSTLLMEYKQSKAS